MGLRSAEAETDAAPRIASSARRARSSSEQDGGVERLEQGWNEFRDRVDALLAQVGLAGFGDKHPWQLSGGMMQRASLCRALVHEPQLLMLDEPLGALDQFTGEEPWGIMQDLWMTRRPTVLLVTHDLKEAAYLANRICVMQARPGASSRKAWCGFRGRAPSRCPTSGHATLALSLLFRRHLPAEEAARICLVMSGGAEGGMAPHWLVRRRRHPRHVEVDGPVAPRARSVRRSRWGRWRGARSARPTSAPTGRSGPAAPAPRPASSSSTTRSLSWACRRHGRARS